MPGRVAEGEGHRRVEPGLVWNAAAFRGDFASGERVLHAAILETSRLYPPVRFVSQLSTAAGEVDIGGQQCPFQKGTRLLGSIFTANHDGERYEDPETFSLERDFSDILSWNGGSRERECPGRALSIELIKVVCMHLLKRYQWKRFTEVSWDFGKVGAFTPKELELVGFAAIENTT